MKRIWMALLLCLSLAALCLAAEKVEAPADCKQCGMDRTAFAHSRMVVTYTDGSSTGTCSLNCVVIDMKESQGKEVQSFQVADYDTKKLVDARIATWVIGGTKRGVMTPVAKWAFAEKQDAEAFVKQNGGQLSTFDDALKAAEKELEEQGQHRKHQGHEGHGEHKM